MQKVVLCAALALLAPEWTNEIEPNDATPVQTLGFEDLRLMGSLSSASDVDLYRAGLGFAWPWVTQWAVGLRLAGEEDKHLELDVYQTHWWYPREHIGHWEGWGEVEAVFLFAHHPWWPWQQQIQVRGEAQRYTLEGPPFQK